MNVNIPFILLSEGFILHERVLPRDGDILPRLERIGCLQPRAACPAFNVCA